MHTLEWGAVFGVGWSILHMIMLQKIDNSSLIQPTWRRAWREEVTATAAERSPWVRRSRETEKCGMKTSSL